MTLSLSRRALLAGGTAAALIRQAQAQAQTPRRGGRLVAAADTEPRNLNPALIASNGVFFVASKVVEPLAEMDYGTGLRPLLATRWRGSDDGLSFTLELRPDVTFHDGEPFTAADVAFCATALWRDRQNLGRAVFANLESVDTPNKHTAVLRFSAPTPAQLIENALPALTSVVPRHRYDGTDLLANPLNLSPVGTGPFRFVEHRPGELYRLTRNRSYWDAGKPFLDEIVFRVLPDAGATAAALETGEIDLTAFSAVPLSDLRRLNSIDGVNVVTGGYEGITYAVTLEMNQRSGPLADVTVRRALAHAIDPSFIKNVIFRGYANTATGPVPKSAAGFYVADGPAYRFDQSEAERLLDAAGYPRRLDGTRFELRLRPAPWFNETRMTGDYVAEALKAVGIDVRLVSADPAAHIAAVYSEHDFDLAIGSPVWRNDPSISTTVLYQSGLPAGTPFTNQYGYASAKMDALIADIATTLDPDERMALTHRFQVLAKQDLPLIHLVEFTFVTVTRERVMNVASNPRWATSGWADTWLSDRS